MKAALFFAFTVLQASPAVAQNANKAAAKEALQFLTPCPASGVGSGLCQVNQSNFKENYILAKSGDPMWMADIALRFYPDVTPDLPASLNIGIRHDERQGCAWMIVTARSYTDPLRVEVMQHRYAAKCEAVSANETAAIQERAEVLLTELRTHPTHAPD